MRPLKPAGLVLAAYGAGLATGLAHFPEPRAVSLGLLLAALWWWRRQGGFYCAVAVAGLLSGQLAWQQEKLTCRARLTTGEVVLRLRLVEPLHTAGDRLDARPMGFGCSGTVSVRWRGPAPLPAGYEAVVQARWIPRPGTLRRPDGVLLVARAGPGQVAGGGEFGLRSWLDDAIRSLYGTRAGTVQALVVNRRGEMPPDLRERYAQAGLVHILSISGFHVGIILGWVVLVARMASLPPVRAGMLGTLVALAYVAFLGWPPPATRAVLLAAVAALSHFRQRRPDAGSVLAVACLLVLVADPWALIQPGAWLSAAAVAGVLAATRWSDRALGRGWPARTAASSVGATVATAPLAAALFGSVSLAGIGLNFVAIPLAALAVPGILASLVARFLFPPIAAPLAAGAGAMLSLLDGIAWWGGGLPGATVLQPAEWSSALPWLGLLGLAGWCIAGGAPRWEAARRAALGLALVVWGGVAVVGLGGRGDGGAGLTLDFLDVGQGDAAVIRTPGHHWILVDAGPSHDGWDAGRRIVAPFLARQRADRLAMAVLSHAHADHLGGMAAVLERFPPVQVVEPAEYVADPLYRAFLDDIAVAGWNWRPAQDGQQLEIDSVRVTVLHPDTAWAEWRLDLNEDSVVLLVEYRGFRALLSGDAGLRAEARLAGRVGPVDLLKVGHHGSRSASGDAWLDELRPRAAVMSLAAGNRYGHPHAEVLARLAARHAAVFRTDRDGTVRVTTDGRVMAIHSDAGDTTLPVGVRDGVRSEE